MADARTPPSGPPPRDPTAPARLLDAAAEIGLRVERAQRELDGLSSAVERLAEAAGVPPGAQRSGDPSAAPAEVPPGAQRSGDPRPEPAPAGDVSDPDQGPEEDGPAPGGGGAPRPPLAGGAPDGDPPAPVAEPSRGMLPAALQTYGSQIGVAVLSLVNAVVMARALGVTGRGEVAFLTAIAFMGSNVWTLGVQEANVNLAGSEPASRRALATNSVLLSILLGVGGALLIAAFIFIVPSAGAGLSWSLLWLTFASFPMLLLSIYLRFLIQGDFGFGVTNLAWFLPAVINVTVNGAFALAGSLTVWVAVSTWIGGQAIATGLMIWHIAHNAAGFGRPDAALAQRTLVFGVKSHFGRVMLLANYRLDQWILGAVGGTKQLGLYSVAVAWAEALFLLPTALSSVQRPSIVRASAREAVRVTARVFRMSVIITAALGAGLIILAPVLCVTIFGEEFRDSVADLRVLTAGAFGVVALKQLGNALTGRDRPVAASLSIGSAFLFTIVLDIVLIPAYGDLGAAIASSVAYTLGGLVIIAVFTRLLDSPARDLIPRRSDVRDLVEIGRGVLSRGR